MKKQIGKLTFASVLTAGAVMGIAGCTIQNPAAGVYGPPPDFGIEDDVDEPMPDVYGPPEIFEPEIEEPEEPEKEHWIATYDSDDGDVSMVLDYDEGTAVIVDGDEEIPVDIAMGVYGPRIMKCDIDGDGEDEYVISECEGTGTGYSTRGLCIVKKKDSGYEFAGCNCEYLIDIINNRLSYSYDADTNEIRFMVANGDAVTVYPVALEGEDKLEDVVFTDIVDVYFEDGQIYMSASSGLIFEGHGWPEYEQAIEAYAPITVDAGLGITVGDFAIRPDDGLK